MPRLLQQGATARMARLVSAAVFSLWVVRVAPDPLRWVSLLPVDVMEPVGLLGLLPGAWRTALLHPVALESLKLGTLALLAASIVRGPSSGFALLSCGALTLYQTIGRSFAGHMDHKDLVLLYAAYLVAALPIADRIAARPRQAEAATRRRVEAAPVVAILAMLCATYALVGVNRLLRGGLEIYTSGTLTFWALRNSFQLAEPAWGLGRLVLEHPLLGRMLELGFPVVTVFEVLAPLCLVSRPFRRLFVATMVPFHLLSWMLLEVFFWEHLMLYPLFLEPRRGRFRP